MQEVVNLTLDVIDYSCSRILVTAGKGGKDRIVFISNDAAVALANYLKKRHRPEARLLQDENLTLKLLTEDLSTR